MIIKISGGNKEKGIIVGNTYNKYNSYNPIVRHMMRKFEEALSDFVALTGPKTIHEVGCGEGYWVLKWNSEGIIARGSDFSNGVLNIAKENAVQRDLSKTVFNVCSIYDLKKNRDSADLIVCCEVLEHLEHPQIALSALQRIVTKHLLVSVPREPLWRILNMARGKYISNFGNTPGHVQHWSKIDFVNLLSDYFHIISIKTPIPWTILLCSPL